MKERIKALLVAGITRQYPYSTHALKRGWRSHVAYEICLGFQIRIDGIKAADHKALYRMLDKLVAEARRTECSRIVYADKLDDDVAEMLVAYGFDETQVVGSDPNRYLTYKVG